MLRNTVRDVRSLEFLFIKFFIHSCFDSFNQISQKWPTVYDHSPDNSVCSNRFILMNRYFQRQNPYLLRYRRNSYRDMVHIQRFLKTSWLMIFCVWTFMKGVSSISTLRKSKEKAFWFSIKGQSAFPSVLLTSEESKNGKGTTVYKCYKRTNLFCTCLALINVTRNRYKVELGVIS